MNSNKNLCSCFLLLSSSCLLLPRFKLLFLSIFECGYDGIQRARCECEATKKKNQKEEKITTVTLVLLSPLYMYTQQDVLSLGLHFNKESIYIVIRLVYDFIDLHIL